MIVCYWIFIKKYLFLQQDGIMSLEDVDTAMCEGLGLRYAFVGPLETCHLNANGKKYSNKFILHVTKSFLKY